ncbi:MAG: class I SAM-dependent methyltransferase [Scytolyngbya sp. HA4215-MV1]|nr:class I SAM-dependent methyltransferase [Scytolyngbya sp. HA4215-MV1]
MSSWYNEDLAYIHDVGFCDYALQANSSILASLAQQGIQHGLVVELGCGSGLSTQAFAQAGYDVLGVDISAAMIAIAQARVPTAQFRVASLFQTEIPPCQVVVAIGECFNYLFDAVSDVDSTGDRSSLMPLFQRIYTALVEDGLLIFDIVEPGQITPHISSRNFTEGKDWFVLVEKSEDPEQRILTRRIITFRQIDDYYRRSDEVHRQRLYFASELATELASIGFQVQISRHYGQYELPPARAALVAHKPSRSSH